ncbi:MAG: hypothetical protein HC832_08460, partial [Leptolyngbyaceae cyanobacterium RM1_405_57]|nr:hypothetical protein [Leptolyngbyaceae cyanobacterium RM1_405_57]
KAREQQERLVVNHAGIQRLSSHELKQARADLDALFEADKFEADEFEADEPIDVSATETTEGISLNSELVALLEQAQKTLDTLEDEQSEELQDLLEQIEERSPIRKLTQSQNSKKNCLTSCTTSPPTIPDSAHEMSCLSCHLSSSRSGIED